MAGKDLEDLKSRLSRLGVTVPSPGGTPNDNDVSIASSVSDIARLTQVESLFGGHKKATDRSFFEASAETEARAPMDTISHPPPGVNTKEEVMDVLRRCNEIEQCLQAAETAASASGLKPSSMGEGGPRGLENNFALTPPSFSQPPIFDNVVSATKKKRRPKSAKPSYGIASASASASAALTAAATAARVHCASGCGSSRIREVEHAMAKERIALKRESTVERKRVVMLEKEVLALRTHLDSRSTQEMNLTEQHQSLVAMTLERDDLLGLLRATMKKLETADEVVRRSTQTGAELEAKVEQLAHEHSIAMEEAKRASEQADGLNKDHQNLLWSQEVMQRISEVQLGHYRNKRKVLQDLLETQDPITRSHLLDEFSTGSFH
ncbi:hypothetical protein CYMTET_13025 [Cymbomonas tetramitiformis]|uniref:Uncharacterized protein n=1 Tax=Cymbomonas tetramitiformis TaxID=36881 RepID=A0AAE0GJ94_9CHLO|nr:hypothetical protein CYMTET_13025 [Cymbomonas tetramitiformis]